MESDLIGSLIPAVDRSFRTLASRQNRAVGGLSTGGYGAANLALRHPELFRLAIVLRVDPLEPEANSFGGNQARQRANDPLVLARVRAGPDSPAFFVGWGTADPAAPESEEFVRTLQEHGYTVMTAPVPGGHEPAVWESTL
jgi:S-formylglutathione hydrolase FrmB